MYFVYVIQSLKNEDLYKGFTTDIKERLKQHNSGLTESTKTGIPWKLIYCEIFLDKQDAIDREKYLKCGWGREYLKKTLKHYLENKRK